MSNRLSRISPLAKYTRSDAVEFKLNDVSVKELRFLCHYIVRFDPENQMTRKSFRKNFATDVPTDPNTFNISDDILFAWLGPDEWLILSQLHLLEKIEESLDEIVANPFATWVDVSSSQTLIRVTGPKGIDLLSRGINCDLHPSVFLPGNCLQTIMARIPVTVLKQESDTLTMDLIVKRSYAEYLWNWLVDAGREAEFRH